MAGILVTGVPHGLENTGTGNLVFLVVTAPVSDEA